MPRNEFSDLIATYASTMGVTRRTAQRHKKEDHPDWRLFIGKTAVEGAKKEGRQLVVSKDEATALATVCPLAPTGQPAFYDIDESELHPVQLKEKQAWELHAWTFQQWKTSQSDPVTAILAKEFLKELPELRENHEKAMKAREEWERRERLTYSAGEFQAFVKEFIAPMGELLGNIPTELPPLVNPDDQPFARKSLVDWVRDKVGPRVKEMLKGAEEFLAA